MAPTLGKPSSEAHLKSLLDFAQGLERRLQVNIRDPKAFDQVNQYIECLPLPSKSSPILKSDELDLVGTELWNLSTKLRRDGSFMRQEDLCALRVFAFLLLDSAHAVRPDQIESAVRVMRVALKAARCCLENAQFTLSLKSLERAAFHESKLSNEDTQLTKEDNVLQNSLRLEYFQLRIALSWKQSRLDIAEQMYSRVEENIQWLQAAIAEKLADLLYEIGKDLAQRKHFASSVKWLERSHNIINMHDLDKLGQDAGEVKQSITQTLVKSLRELHTPETNRRAWNLVDYLEHEYGEKTAVSLLKMELLSSEKEVDVTKYYDVLVRVVRTISLNEATFKTVQHHVHVLKGQSEKLACDILDKLINERLLEASNISWMEKAMVTRIWLSSKFDESEDHRQAILSLQDRISTQFRGALGLSATHAAQTLLWKRLESCFRSGDYEAASVWCRIALHPLYNNSGELNRAKIQRKSLMCSISAHDYETARSIFYDMSDETKSAPITRYIVYSMAMRSGDSDLAAESLDLIFQNSKSNNNILYACVLEAQEKGDRKQAISVLLKILGKHRYQVPDGIHLATLLRCTFRLMVKELGPVGDIDQKMAHEIAKLFEGVVIQANDAMNKTTKQSPAFGSTEIEWFTKNSYNLALKYCADLVSEDLERLLTGCIELLEILANSGVQPQEISLRRCFCHFFTVVVQLTMARAVDAIEQSLQHYTELRKHGQLFRSLAESQIGSKEVNEALRKDLVSKHFKVVKYEIEAALKLVDWDSLDGLFKEAWKYESPKPLETLADLAMVVHSKTVQEKADPKYQAKILAILQKIINSSWRSSHQSKNDGIIKLARWIRCLFQISLSFDEAIGLQCLDQATKISSKLVEQGNPPYPSDELEWLASTAFNRAVDFYCASDNVNCKVWAQKALSMAAAVAGVGKGLHKTLMEKYGKLAWEEGVD